MNEASVTEDELPQRSGWTANGFLLLRNWTAMVIRWPKTTLLVAAALTVLFAVYTANNLGVSTNTEEMISNKLEWRQDFKALRNHFPQLNRVIAVVIDAQTEALAEAAVNDLDQRLDAYSELIKSRFAATVNPPIAGRELLLLEEDELFQIADDLAVAQPFFGRLRKHYSLPSVFELLTEAYNNDASAVPEAFAQRLSTTIQQNNDGKQPLLDWSRLNTFDDKQARRILFVNPIVDRDRPRSARRIIEALREQGAAMTSAFDDRVHVRLTGKIALEDDELVTVSQNFLSTAWLALVCVCLILLIAFRSFRLLVISIVTLLTGLIATAAFAAVSVVTLNIISIAFAILYIGLGIDFVIHYLLRLREILVDETDLNAALIKTSDQVGGALAICAVTTAAGFFAFMPTAFIGVSQLGLISGVGMLISFVVTLTLLPALIRLAFPKQMHVEQSALRWSPGLLFSWLLKAPWLVIGVILITAAMSLAYISQLRFEKDPMLLSDPTTESVQAFKDLSNDPDTALRSIAILANDNTDKSLLIDKITALPSVERVYTLESFNTVDATEQQFILEDIQLLLGEDFANYPKLEPVAPDETIVAIRELIAELSENGSNENFRTALTELLTQAEQLDGAEQQKKFNQLQHSLLGDLPQSMQLLKSRLQAEPLHSDDFPEQFQRRWVSTEGHRLIQAIPAKDVAMPENAVEFVNEVTDVASNATGVPVVYERSGNTVISAFKVAFATALVVISTLLFFLLRSLASVAVVLAPLALSALLLTGAMVLFELPFNFANVIALPLLLGISVDTGIHLIHRINKQKDGLQKIFTSSTTRAIIFSSATTFTSFGNLALSTHIGMASMGQLLALGLIVNVVIMLLLLPALMMVKR